MKKLFILFFIGALSISTFAQSGKLKKADELYSHLAYAEAINIYKDLIGTDQDGYDLNSKLADCYYQLGLTELAEYYYSTLIHSPNVRAYDVYNYAQALKENGRYSESAVWMSKFYKLDKSDIRGREFMNNQDYLDYLKSQENTFELMRLDSLNSIYTDFGGYYLDSTLYIISNRNVRSAIQNYHALNNELFLDIYKLPLGQELSSATLTRERKEINSNYHEGPLCFSRDSKIVYFTRNNRVKGEDGIKNLKIYVADIVDGSWMNQRELSINSPDYSVGHPTLSADGTILYFVSDMPGGYGGADLYKVAVDKGEVIGTPQNLGDKINTDGQEVFPWIATNNILYYSSDGHLGLGGLDVFAVVPSSGHIENVNLGSPINSLHDDFAFIMHSGNSYGHVSSNREGGKGGDDIYAFSLKNKVLPLSLNLSGLVLDELTEQILPNATVQLMNSKGEVLAEAVSDNDGNYSFSVLKGEEYQLKVIRESYPESKFVLNTNYSQDLDQDQCVKRDLLLNQMLNEKTEAFYLVGVIADEETGKGVRNALVKIYDLAGFEVGEVLTDENGNYQVQVQDFGNYIVTGSQESYYANSNEINLTNEEGQFDLELEPKRIGSEDVVDLYGLVLDDVTRETVPNAIIDFKWGTYNVQIIADEEGMFSCSVPQEGLLYSATSQQGFKTSYDTLDLGVREALLDENGKYTLNLKPDLNSNSLIFVVERGLTHAPLEGVKVSLENHLGMDLELVSDYSGLVKVALSRLVVDSALNLVLHLEKEGYISQDIPIQANGLSGEDVYGNTLIGEPIELYKEFENGIIVLDDIYFDWDKANIRQDASLELDSLVQLMNKYPEMEIYFTSHTDCRGSKAYNLRLSQKRAASTKAYIQARITNPERINGEGKGEEMLVNDCGCEGSQTSDCTEEQHAENRRTEFEIIKME